MRNEEGRVATPTSFLIFDSYDMKSLWFKFGHNIFTGIWFDFFIWVFLFEFLFEFLIDLIWFFYLNFIIWVWSLTLMKRTSPKLTVLQATTTYWIVDRALQPLWLAFSNIIHEYSKALRCTFLGPEKIFVQGVLALCEFHYCEFRYCKFHYCDFSKISRYIGLMHFLGQNIS